MLKKDIYIIKNSVNDKVYIGQSKNAAERWLEHIYNSRYESKVGIEKQLIHKAMLKYGYDKFHYEILESQIENYDEREIYWIKRYNSLTPNGYNVATGGAGCGYGLDSICGKFKDNDMLMKCIGEISSSNKSFNNIAKEFGCSQEVISAINLGNRYRIDGMQYPLRSNRYSSEVLKQVRYLLKHEDDLTLNDIAKMYDIDISQTSLINQGKIYYVNGESYPLRKKRKRDLDNNVVELIIEDIDKSNLCMTDIAKKYNISKARLSGINTGKFYTRNNLTYPIREESDSRNAVKKKFLDRNIVLEIMECIRSGESFANIAQKYNISKTMVSDINNGKCKKYHINGIQYPIRDSRRKQPVSTIHA